MLYKVLLTIVSIASAVPDETTAETTAEQFSQCYDVRDMHKENSKLPPLLTMIQQHFRRE